MAVPASILLPCSSSSPKFPIKVLKQQPWQFQRYLGLQIHHKPFSTCCMKVSMSQFDGETNEAKMQISVLKETLWEAIPTPVKDLEWKKAAEILLHRLMFLAQKTLKWSIVVYFIFSTLSDFAFSILRNQELMIPFGLFTGCLISNILNETSQQVLSHSEEKELDWHLTELTTSRLPSRIACNNLKQYVLLIHRVQTVNICSVSTLQNFLPQLVYSRRKKKW